MDKSIRRKKAIQYLLLKSFQKYSRLYFCKLTLGYDKNYLNNISEKQFLIHSRKLSKELNRFYPVNLKVGMIKKQEYTLLKGYHIHLCLIFPAKLINNSSSVMKTVKELWLKILNKHFSLTVFDRTIGKCYCSNLSHWELNKKENEKILRVYHRRELISSDGSISVPKAFLYETKVSESDVGIKPFITALSTPAAINSLNKPYYHDKLKWISRYQNINQEKLIYWRELIKKNEVIHCVLFCNNSAIRHNLSHFKKQLNDFLNHVPHLLFPEISIRHCLKFNLLLLKSVSLVMIESLKQFWKKISAGTFKKAPMAKRMALLFQETNLKEF